MKVGAAGNFSAGITLLHCTLSAPQRAPMNKALTIMPAAAGIVPNEHVEDGRTPPSVEADPHSARLGLDDVEWLDRLAKLAELRESGE
jgi:hypothetical protein